MAIGGVDRCAGGIPEADRVDVEEPSFPGAGPSGGKKNVASVEIRMTKAVMLELCEEPADSGKDPGALPGEGPGRKEVVEIAPPLNKGSGNFHAKKKPGRVKKGCQNTRGGNAQLNEAFRPENFTTNTAGPGIEVAGKPTPKTAMHTGPENHRAQTRERS